MANKVTNLSNDDVDEKLIDEAVAFINETANKTIYKGSIEIGEYILENFFSGDLKLASSKNPKKLLSFNKLCEREDLTVHPNRLGLMVRVASQERFLAGKKVNTEELSYTHKAALVKLDNTDKKITAIEKCIKEKWSTRDLDDEIKRLIQGLPASTNLSLIQTIKRYITKVDDVLKAVEDSSLDIGDDELSKMSDKRRKGLENYLTELKTKIDDTVKKTEDIKIGCDGLLTKLTQVAKKKIL
ncbi:MAG: hypothetical protein A2277_20645 [Desulfobacterales bacterium RIFOXYA12_FULL_46_15]|nr:MAG: hypothetical protein A2277_20645 [Desulfobacterales bacterium RIFOXYA12_FULL_46_15]